MNHFNIEYIPARGDVVNINFDPQAGKEIKKNRFALVISQTDFNKLGFALVCPITSTIYNDSFEVLIPKNQDVHGVILCNQVKSLDWKARDAAYKCRLPKTIVARVLGIIDTILNNN